jgi:hypothetical protein
MKQDVSLTLVAERVGVEMANGLYTITPLRAG